jgi:hypothetical protein
MEALPGNAFDAPPDGKNVAPIQALGRSRRAGIGYAAR